METKPKYTKEEILANLLPQNTNRILRELSAHYPEVTPYQGKLGEFITFLRAKYAPKEGNEMVLAFLADIGALEAKGAKKAVVPAAPVVPAAKAAEAPVEPEEEEESDGDDTIKDEDGAAGEGSALFLDSKSRVRTVDGKYVCILCIQSGLDPYIGISTKAITMHAIQAKKKGHHVDKPVVAFDQSKLPPFTELEGQLEAPAPAGQPAEPAKIVGPASTMPIPGGLPTDFFTSMAQGTEAAAEEIEKLVGHRTMSEGEHMGSMEATLDIKFQQIVETLQAMQAEMLNARAQMAGLMDEQRRTMAFYTLMASCIPAENRGALWEQYCKGNSRTDRYTDDIKGVE